MLFQRNVLPGTEPYLGGMPPFWPRHAGAEAVARQPRAGLQPRHGRRWPHKQHPRRQLHF